MAGNQRDWLLSRNDTGRLGRGAAATKTPKAVPAGARVFDWLIGEMVDPTVAESNRLFEVLQEWEVHLAPFDLSDLRCDDEHLR